MKDDKKLESKIISVASTIGNIGIQIGEKLGKVVTEFFTGKQPTKEERELNAIRKERKLKLKLIQEDAEYKNNLRLAQRGEYVPPTPKVEEKKKKGSIGGSLSNLGKVNPLDRLGSGNFKQPDFGLGFGSNSKSPDFGLDGFMGTKNPIGNKKKWREFEL